MPKPNGQPAAPETPTPDNEPSLTDRLMEGQDVDALEEAAAEDDLDTQDPPAGDPGEPAPATGGEPELADDLQEPEGGGGPSSLVDRLADLGFTDVEGDEEGLERLIEAYQLTRSEREQYEQQVRKLQPLADYGTQWIAEQRQRGQDSQAPRQQEPEQAKQPDKWWNPPAFDHLEAERYREFDPTTGGQRWKEDTPAEVRLAAQQYQAYLEKWSQDLVHRPEEVLPKIIEQEFDRLFEDRYGSRVRAQTEEQFYDQMEQQNAHWLYKKDPVTKRIMADEEGYPVTTEAGQMMLAQMERLKQKGMTDPQDIWEFAYNSVAAYYGGRQQQAQNTSEEARREAERKRREHQARATGSLPDRGGSFNNPEVPGDVPQNPKLSIGDRLLQEAEAAGEVIWETTR